MSREYIKLLLKLTKINNPELVAAVMMQLCDGVPQKEAAFICGVKPSAISRLVKRLNEIEGIIKEINKINT